MSTIKKYAIILSLPVISLTSCVSEGNDPGIEYSPNMYISQAYEPYSQEKEFDYNPNGMTMRLPVNGTIARGQLDYVYPHPNTAEGYEASVSFQPQFAATKENVQEGERLYNIYCWHCHGKKGANDGPIFKTKKMNPPPWAGYDDPYIKELPVGKIYHTIQYGKGFMGSHAAMLNPEQRWQVIHYVKYLSLGDAFTFASDDEDLAVAEVEVSDSTEAATN
ncbi:cytochrome c [bacterium]|nr:cytochrome c [bacterium]